MKGTAKRAKPVAPVAPKRTRLVRFEYVNPAAKCVCIAGTFNDWRPGTSEMLHVGEDRWAKELALAPGRHEYRLVVDGLWLTDPACPESAPNPYGERNSVLTVLAEG